MLRNTTTITHAAALEFRMASSLDRRADADAYGILFRIDARTRRRVLEGTGESWLRASVRNAASWSFLERALERPVGLTLGGKVAGVRADIAELVDGLRRQALDGPGPTAQSQARVEAIAGIDMALVDLGAKIVDLPMAEFLGGRRQPMPVATVVSARQDVGRLRKRIAASGARSAVRLIGVPDVAVAEEAAALASESTGRLVPIWLELEGAWEDGELSELVERLAKRVIGGGLPHHLVLHAPAEAVSFVQLDNLQATADALVPHRAKLPGIVIMADVQSPDETDQLMASRLRGANLNLQRLGGILATYAVARVLCRRHDLQIGLSAMSAASDLANHALIELAAALPKVDYCAPSQMRRGDAPRFARAIAYDEQGQAQPSSGPGIGAKLELTSVAGRLSRYAEVPRCATAPPTYGELRANNFDMSKLKEFTSSSGTVALVSPLLERAALAHGLDTTRMSRNLLVAEHSDLRQPIAFARSKSLLTSVPARLIADNKELTRELLRNAGVEAPEGEVFRQDQIDDAVSYATRLGWPVVVKPHNGRHGKGVSTDLRSEAEVRSAVAALRGTVFRNESFIVEEHIPGDDHRFFVVGDRVVSVVLKEPASVVGNGRSTIVDLVLEKNKRRMENPQTYGSPIRFNADAEYWLKRQGFAADSVPTMGQVVRLGSAGNVAMGGDSIEVLEETHESLLDLAVRAVRAVPGLDHSGIDLVGDRHRPLSEQRAAVIEVNASPVVTLNHFPVFGPPRDVAREIIIRQCTLQGFIPGPPRSELSVRTVVEGRVQGVGYRQWFARIAEKYGVVGSIQNVAEGRVEAVVSGHIDDVWALISRAIDGPRRASVQRVITTHLDAVGTTDRFEVL